MQGIGEHLATVISEEKKKEQAETESLNLPPEILACKEEATTILTN